MACVLASGCTGNAPPVGEIGNVEGFLGGAMVEEPRAALIARDVLSAGGTAADGAVAAFFALAMTYPLAVGLGGGGICLVHDPAQGKVETLEFLPAPPRQAGPIAVPGALRGMAALHARYGRLAWASLVSPAESLGRLGHPISRALARRLPANAGKLTGQPTLARQFTTPEGTLKREGDAIRQVELSSVLAQIRSRGAGDFYSGQAARTFVAAANEFGGRIDLEDLRGYRPVWRATRRIAFGNLTAHLALPPPRAGNVAHALLQRYIADGVPGDPALRDRLNLAAFAEQGDQPAVAAGEAGLVVVDRAGGIVVCGFSMGEDFGLGRMLPTMGILVAPNRPTYGAGLAPLAVVNHNVDQAFFGAITVGGAIGPVATAALAYHALAGEKGLEQAIDEPRWLRTAAGAPLVLEAAAEAGLRALTGPAPPRRHDTLGRTQAFYCANGLPRAPQTCSFASDRRGFGLAAGAEQ